MRGVWPVKWSMSARTLLQLHAPHTHTQTCAHTETHMPIPVTPKTPNGIVDVRVRVNVLRTSSCSLFSFVSIVSPAHCSAQDLGDLWEGILLADHEVFSLVCDVALDVALGIAGIFNMVWHGMAWRGA